MKLDADVAAGFAQGSHQFQDRLALELADTFAGQAEVFADSLRVIAM